MRCEPEDRGLASGAPIVRYVCKWHPVAWVINLCGADACMTPWGRIYILHRSRRHSKWLIRHEICHLRQMQRDGQLKYWSRYYWWCITRGYRNNPYEIEANHAAEAKGNLY